VGVAVAADTRRPAVRRNTVLLGVAQGSASMTFPVLLIVGSVAASDLAGRDGIVGVVNAGYFLAAAAGALAFGRVMDRIGRRVPLAVAYLLLAIAGAGCGFAIAAGSLGWLLACTTLFGLAYGGSNLARAAVADMYPPEQRGRAVGLVLAAATVGAVGSPFVVASLRGFAEREALDPDVLPWIVVPVVALIALVCALALRPDPRELAVREEVAMAASRRPPRELLRTPAMRTAVLAAAVGQMAMVSVMGVTPVALEHHHASSTVVSGVISLHIVGMFGLVLVVGQLVDRVGRHRALVGGLLVMAVSSVLLAWVVEIAGISLSLFLLGLGWNISYVAAVTELADRALPSERGRLIGLTDQLSSFTAAALVLLGGVLYSELGVEALALAATAFVVLPAAWILVRSAAGAPDVRPLSVK